MTWKQIEASREARLWTTQVIMPVVALVTTVAMVVPEFRAAVVAKAKDVKERIKYKTQK